MLPDLNPSRGVIGRSRVRMDYERDKVTVRVDFKK